MAGDLPPAQGRLEGTPPPIKPFSLSLENGKSTLSHKKQIGDFKSNTKLKLNLKYSAPPRFSELSSKVSHKLWGTSFSFSNKISDSFNLSSKISHSVNLWEGLKAKYGL